MMAALWFLFGAAVMFVAFAAIALELWESRERGYQQMLARMRSTLDQHDATISPPAASGPSSDGGTASFSRDGRGIQSRYLTADECRQRGGAARAGVDAEGGAS